MLISAKARRNTRRLGIRGENAAVRALEADGMIILARNFKCRAGELDIVALDGNELVFVEVKSRRYRRGFLPALNLSSHQRRRNRNAAKLYCKLIGSPPLAGRFDLVEVIYRSGLLISLRRTENYLLPLPPGTPESC
jgi:putative endonuclease